MRRVFTSYVFDFPPTLRSSWAFTSEDLEKQGWKKNTISLTRVPEYLLLTISKFSKKNQKIEKNKWSKQGWVNINKGLGRESGGQN